VLVEDAVGSGIDGPFLIKGWSVSDDQGARLCASLLESMPPQCGLPSIELELGGADLAGDFVTEADVTWSAEPVSSSLASRAGPAGTLWLGRRGVAGCRLLDRSARRPTAARC